MENSELIYVTEITERWHNQSFFQVSFETSLDKWLANRIHYAFICS